MKKIGISAPIKSSGQRRMLDAFGAVFGIKFEVLTFGDDAGVAAWILLEADQEVIFKAYRCNHPCYIIICQDLLIPCGDTSVIEISGHSNFSSVLRGRKISTDEAIELKALPEWLQNTTAIASKGGASIWAMQKIGRHQHYYISLPIPELNEGESLFEYFNGNQFLALLPFLFFLRSLDDENDWVLSPLHACFMFDDPNLHWRTYGFIDFSEIAQHAKLNNYHVAFATIPLDAWFVHAPTASLFKQHRDFLSLLIHGNDHIKKELGRSSSTEEISHILQQALWRIREFERHSGIEVSRIMAPPHGACSEQFLEEMARLGFEAACISTGSLRYYNHQAAWLRNFGMRPSENIRGMTIFPRFRISCDCHNSILVAALLNQPIIPVGHHHDLAEGLDLLGELSEFINSLGNVHWGDLKGISRSHYVTKIDGKILHVKMFSKRVEVQVPDEIVEICVKRPWLEASEFESLAWRSINEESIWKTMGHDELIAVSPAQRIEIVSYTKTPIPIDAKPSPTLHFWPFVRRQLTEARDRMTPVFRHISAMLSSR